MVQAVDGTYPELTGRNSFERLNYGHVLRWSENLQMHPLSVIGQMPRC